MFDVGNKRCVVFLRNTKFNHNFPPEIGVCVVITHAYIIHSVGSVVNENQVYRMITNLVTGCKNNQNPTKLSVAADVLLTYFHSQGRKWECGKVSDGSATQSRVIKTPNGFAQIQYALYLYDVPHSFRR